jgi:hypothetical protein
MLYATDKYRGTRDYIHVLAELVRAAQYHGLTTYQDIAVIRGLPIQGNLMGKETGQILGEISEDEVKVGRPMLSALCVRVDGKVGPGFFKCAKDVGQLGPAEDEQSFWETERDAVYAAWRRPLPKE